MKSIATTLLLSVSLLFMSCGKDYDYEIGLDQQIVINLESTGYDGGYSWCWDKRDNILDSVCWKFIPYDENHDGSPGIEQWVFVGTHKGTTTIHLGYKHPWEADVLYSREYTVLVE